MIRYLFVALGTITALWTTGCRSPLTTNPSVTTTSEGQKNEGPAGTAVARGGEALVRFVNADSAGNAMDLVRVDGKFFSNIPYKSITPYREAARGRAVFKLRAVGQEEDLSAAHRELLPGRHYTLVALPKKRGRARLAVLNDNLGLLEPGITRVRLVNATTDVDDLDLFTAGSKIRILHGIDPGAAVSMSYADMEAGEVEIRAPERPSPTLVAKLQVETNRLYTFIAVGNASAMDVIRIVDTTQP